MRPPLPHTLALTLCGLLGLSACVGVPPRQPASQTTQNPSAPPARQSHAADLLDRSARCLLELRKASANHTLDAALEDARAVIVLPGVYQAGFFYSIHAGDGVLVARRADGGWGAPVFLSVGGAGYGVQAGLEMSRLVLAVMEEEMLERILAGGFTFDATAKYDMLGVREETGPGNLTTERPVMAFSDGVGLMAGVALRGGLLRMNEGLTQVYHDRTAGEVAQVIRGTSAPGLEVFSLWNALVLEEQPGPEIIRLKRP